MIFITTAKLLRRSVASAAIILGAGLNASAQDAGSYEARALVTTNDWAVLSSQILAPIASMPRKPGDTFRKGDVLVVHNCATYEAQAAAGDADMRQAKAQLAAQERLFELNSAGALDVEIARAAFDKASANVKLQQVMLDRCTVLAPYDGAVVRWAAQPNQTVNGGDELIEIVGTTGLELELIVPSAWLAWLKVGQEITAAIDETGAEVAAKVSRLNGRIDPVSQTIKIYAKIEGGKAMLLPGMSGRALVQSETR